MIPTSISATALQVAEACPARYKAEHFEKARSFGSANNAAMRGSTVHGALEDYVRVVYIEKAQPPSFELLTMFLQVSYTNIFGAFDNTTEEYADCYEMLDRWYKRTDLSDVRIISVEKKDNFLVQSSAGNIPFNYIWDRFDEIRPGVFKVVDYKSNRWGLRSEDLQKKIQARAYSLAAAIQLKATGVEYEKIWVEFDLLRHERVGRVFTREENAATWYFIKNQLQAIIDTPEDQFVERLNPECRFCVRKADCAELRKNLLVGGIHSIGDLDKLVDLRAQLEWQQSGLTQLAKELDERIEAECKELDILKVESDMAILEFKRSKRRGIDGERVEQVIGPQLFERYGTTKITMQKVDELLRGNKLTPEQKVQLRGLVYDKFGEATPKITPKNPIDD